MQIGWWQDGFHVVPESDKEHEALCVIIDSLRNGIFDLDDGTLTQGDNQKPVAGIKELEEIT